MSTKPTPVGPEKSAYRGKMIEVVEQPMQIGEKKVIFEFARRAPGTRLIIPTSDGKIILSKEYRSEINGYDFRLPGGKAFDSLEEYKTFLKKGSDLSEAAEKAAIKEAREEVGIVVNEMALFGISKCGATVEWDLYYFVVRSYGEGLQQLEQGENIQLAPTDREEVRNMCHDGRIQEDRSALMLLRYLQR